MTQTDPRFWQSRSWRGGWIYPSDSNFVLTLIRSRTRMCFGLQQAALAKQKQKRKTVEPVVSPDNPKTPAHNMLRGTAPEVGVICLLLVGVWVGTVLVTHFQRLFPTRFRLLYEPIQWKEVIYGMRQGPMIVLLMLLWLCCLKSVYLPTVIDSGRIWWLCLRNPANSRAWLPRFSGIAMMVGLLLYLVRSITKVYYAYEAPPSN